MGSHGQLAGAHMCALWWSGFLAYDEPNVAYGNRCATLHRGHHGIAILARVVVVVKGARAGIEHEMSAACGPAVGAVVVVLREKVRPSGKATFG